MFIKPTEVDSLENIHRPIPLKYSIMLERNYVLKLLIPICSLYFLHANKSDVVFVVDTSESIVQSDFDEGVDFLKEVVSALTIGSSDVYVSVVSFSSSVTERFDLDDHTDQSSLITAIENLKSITTDGGTFTFDALDYVANTSFTAAKGARSDASPIVIVMTDGVSANQLQTRDAANKVRSDVTGSVIYAIGVGSQLSETNAELQLIASDPDSDNIFYVSSFIYICNLIPSIVVKIDSSVTANVPSDCAQITTTVWSGKGKGTTAAPTTTTTTTAAPTTTTTTAAPTTTTTTAAPTTTTTTAAPTTTTTTAAPTTTTTTAAPTTTTTTAAPTTTTTTAAPTTTTTAAAPAAGGSSTAQSTTAGTAVKTDIPTSDNSGNGDKSDNKAIVIGASVAGGVAAVTLIAFGVSRLKKAANAVTPVKPFK